MATYYVATTGNDTTGNGSEGNPWLTIQKAVDAMVAGDTTIVEDGTYAGTEAGERIVETFEMEGTSNAPFTLRARNTRQAIIDGDGVAEVGIRFNSSSSWWVVQGFVFTGTVNLSTGGCDGVEIFGSAISNITIRDCDFHTIGKTCSDTSNGMNGVFVGASSGATTNVLIERCRFWDIGRFGNGESACTPGNNNWQNHDHAIYVAEADQVTIRNCIFRDNDRGWSIQRFNTGGHNSVDLLILNNTFVRENPNRDGHIIIATSTTGIRIENNIFYDPRGAAVSITGGTHTDGEITNNLVHAAAITTGSLTGFSVNGNLETTDPLFTDVDNNDFTLTASSPAIGAGIALAEVTDDFDGTVRPQGDAHDLGAHELVGAAAPPAPDSGWPCRTVGASRARVFPPRIRKEYWVEPGSVRTTDPATDSTHD